MAEPVRPPLILDPVAAAASAARAYVSAALAECGASHLEGSAELGVSELVTNAVLHGRTALTVAVVTTPGGRVRIEVTDHSPLPPQRRRLSALATTGRGLRLVEAVSDDWGIEPVPAALGGGKTIWFEPLEEPSAESFLDADWAAELDALQPN